jgi:hypothetical protein
MRKAAPPGDSTRSMVMPLARSAVGTSMHTAMPSASATTSCGARSARPIEALKRASIDSLRSLPGARPMYSRMRVAAAGVMVTVGTMRCGTGLPSISCSSPLA